MGFRRDSEGDYQHEASRSYWVLMKPAVPGEFNQYGRIPGKWEARNCVIGAPSVLFDTLEAAALWVILEVGDG